MHFFETIEGLKGENLTSAVLKYLLANSTAVRSMFAELISKQVPPSEVPSFRNGISCETEVNCDGNGFIDLLIRSDNELIGIENKLWAEIQNEQPKKYVSHLLRLSKSENRSENILLIVMAPRERKREVEAEVKRQNITQRTLVIYWQDALLQLQKLRGDSQSNQVITTFFVEFLESYLGPLRIPKAQVIGQVGIGNKYQIDLLVKLQHLVNDVEGFSARKLASGKTFYGFGFDYQHKSVVHRLWFGFIEYGGECFFAVQELGPNIPFETPGLTRIPNAWNYGELLGYEFPTWPESMVEWRDFLDLTFERIIQKAEKLAQLNSTETTE